MKWIIVFIFSLFLMTSATAAQSDQDQHFFVNQPDVKVFIQQMVTKNKFREKDLLRLFNAVIVRQRVVQNVKYPVEQKPWYFYRMMYVTEKRIAEGVIFWNTYQDVLAKAEKTYGVPASIIVATMGVESKYGKKTGDYRVIDALVNLAFGSTLRTAFFRQELEQFLLLTREQRLDPLTVMGSYAGAIGQPQFMPSSYRHYAVNFSGNATIDLNHNEADVIGSIANYYHQNGWQPNQPVVIPASIMQGEFQWNFVKPKAISFAELLYQHVIPDAALLPKQNKLLILQRDFGNEYWLSYHNFDVIKRYNHSDLYAMAVYQLSYFIARARGVMFYDEDH